MSSRLNVSGILRRTLSSLHVPSSSSSSQAANKASISAPAQSFHKRPLPSNLIALSSAEGKQIFKEALLDGSMECYFPLAEQFVTQSEPSYCSVSSLAMVLNALNYDPKRVWKGAWRWVSEEMLNCESEAVCGHSLERIKSDGLSFHEFESLARCHGVRIESYRVCHSVEATCGRQGFEQFKQHIINTSRTDQAQSFTVVNYSRKHLNQTGDGHFSPIGGYHRERDLVLILDVARFKYPPYWVKITDMWDSMALKDKATDQTRGYFVISTWNDQDLPQARKQQQTETEHLKNVVCPPGIRAWKECGSHSGQHSSQCTSGVQPDSLSHAHAHSHSHCKHEHHHHHHGPKE